MRAWWLLAPLLLLSDAATAQYFIPGSSDALPGFHRRMWIAPGRLFALDLPAGWNIAGNDKDSGDIELQPADGAGDASLYIRRLAVPPGAAPRQLLLNSLEQRLRKLPSWQEGTRRDVKVSASPAAVVDGVYYFQGNAQYPRSIEELYVVRGEEAYAFHFDCFQPLAAGFATALEVVYKSFVIRPPGKGGEGVPPPASRGGIDTDRIPY